MNTGSLFLMFLFPILSSLHSVATYTPRIAERSTPTVSSVSVVKDGFSAIAASTSSAPTLRNIIGPSFPFSFAIVDSRNSTSNFIKVLNEKGIQGTVVAGMTPPRYEIIVTSSVDLGRSTLSGPDDLTIDDVDALFEPSPTPVTLAASERSRSARALLPAFASGYVVLRKTYNSTGAFTETLRAPRVPGNALLTVYMVNEHQQVFQDSVSMSFNTHVYSLLKYLLLVPFFLTFIVLVSARKTPAKIRAD